MVETATCPKGYMLMFNISKSKNFGTIIRSAAAFNLAEVYIVEKTAKKKSKISTFGSQGTSNKMDMRFFDSLKDVKEHCTENKIAVCGIEIMPSSQPI